MERQIRELQSIFNTLSEYDNGRYLNTFNRVINDKCLIYDDDTSSYIKVISKDGIIILDTLTPLDFTYTTTRISIFFRQIYNNSIRLPKDLPIPVVVSLYNMSNIISGIAVDMISEHLDLSNPHNCRIELPLTIEGNGCNKCELYANLVDIVDIVNISLNHINSIIGSELINHVAFVGMCDNDTDYYLYQMSHRVNICISTDIDNSPVIIYLNNSVEQLNISHSMYKNQLISANEYESIMYDNYQSHNSDLCTSGDDCDIDTNE